MNNNSTASLSLAINKFSHWVNLNENIKYYC
jgi:hypothetical protein